MTRKGKKWEHIHKLAGKKEKVEEIFQMYKDGEKISEKEGREGIRKVWDKIYKTGKKELTPIHSGQWSEGDVERTEEEYRERREKDRIETGKIWIEGKKTYIHKGNMAKRDREIKKREGSWIR